MVPAWASSSLASASPSQMKLQDSSGGQARKARRQEPLIMTHMCRSLTGHDSMVTAPCMHAFSSHSLLNHHHTHGPFLADEPELYSQYFNTTAWFQSRPCCVQAPPSKAAGQRGQRGCGSSPHQPPLGVGRSPASIQLPAVGPDVRVRGLWHAPQRRGEHSHLCWVVPTHQDPPGAEPGQGGRLWGHAGWGGTQDFRGIQARVLGAVMTCMGLLARNAMELKA